MKKTFLSLALILSMLLSIPMSAWAADSANTYELQNLHFTNLNGDTIKDPPGSCMAAVRMVNNSAMGRTDLLIISAYSSDNQLISFNVLSAFCQSRSFQDFSALINVPADKKLGIVKAFVWDSFKNMTALSNTLSTEVNPPYVPVIPVYAAKGKITETYRINVNYGTDKAKFTFTSAFEENGVTIPAGDSLIINLKNVDPSEDIGLPLNVKFEIDADKNLVLTGYSVDQNVKYVERLSSLVDSCSTSAIQIYDTADAYAPTNYALSSDAVFYVNGVPVDLDSANLERYIKNNPGETLILADIGTSTQIADGKYDAIYINFYGTARVDAYSPITNRLSFSQYTSNMSTSLTVGSNVIFKGEFAGDEISASDLQAGDVLSIQYNVNDSVRYSPFYTVQVSRDTFEGKYTSYSTETETIQIGDTSYPVVLDGLSFDDWRNYKNLTLSAKYACALDAFGRIFAIEYIASADNIAIADKVVASSSYDNYGLTLYTTDGISKTYEVDPRTSGWATLQEAIDKIYYRSVIDNANKKDINERVVEYKINTKGQITSLKLLNGVKSEAKFRSNTLAIGLVRMNKSTVVIDATEYDRYYKVSDLQVTTVDGFKDDTGYLVYGYGTKSSDGAYPFVLVVAGEGKYSEDSPMAVVTGLTTVTNEGGDTLDALNLLIPGEDAEVTLQISDDAYLMQNENLINAASLNKGDVVVYSLNAKNQIKDLDVVFKGDQFAASNGYHALASAMMKDGDHSDMVMLPSGTTKWTKEWRPNNSSDTPAQIVVGPIVEKANNSFSIGKIATGTFGGYTGPYTNINKTEGEDGGIYNIGTNAATAVYVYDYSRPSRSNLGPGGIGDIVKSEFARSQMLEDQTVIPWNNLEIRDGVPAGMSVAVVKAVNGIAQAVFIFTGSY